MELGRKTIPVVNRVINTMNTIVMNLTAVSITPYRGGSTLPALGISKVALLIGPTSLSEKGEMYEFIDGGFYKYSIDYNKFVDGWYEEKEPINGSIFDPSAEYIAYYDCIIKDSSLNVRVIGEEELVLANRLALEGCAVYYIRPFITPRGSARVLTTLDQVPILVSPPRVLERPKAKRKQKHVSKSYPVK